MLTALKSKIKKYIRLAGGDFGHLKNGLTVKKRWYGNSYGGFFVCPDLMNEKAVVYSFGIGEDVSFDKSLIEAHRCSVFGFDPTPKSIKWVTDQISLPSEFRFYEYGISDKTGLVDFYLPKNTHHVSGSFVSQVNVDQTQVVKVQMKTLTDIAKELGHERIDVLKMDIEGAEYRVLENIVNSGIPIHQLAVEFHDRFFKDGKAKTIKAIELLKERGFEIFGVSDSLEEVSFINKNIL